jgi:hypothetical protein
MAMAGRYHHTQPGTLMVVALPAGALLCALAGFLTPTPARWVPWAAAFGLVLVASLFSSLTVEVDDDELRWHFGPGLRACRMIRRRRRRRHRRA